MEARGSALEVITWSADEVAAALVSEHPTVIVPFRDDPEHIRAGHLKHFVSHFRKLKGLDVLVVTQDDDGRKFNRGALLNIGAHWALGNGATSLILHDVDLLPGPEVLPFYAALPLAPTHIGWAWTEKYDFARFFGGIVAMSAEDYRRVNGFPNDYFGWGLEDTALLLRCQKAGIANIIRPANRTGITSLPHPHAGDNPAAKNNKTRRDLSADTIRHGLSTVRFSLKTAPVRLAPNITQITVRIL